MMKNKLVAISLVSLIVLLCTIPVSANPWDDLKQFEKLGTAQKISDITKIETLDRPLKISDMNSLSLTSNNLNDPFRTNLVQPTSSFSTSRINPFDTIVPTTNLIDEIPSTSLYDSYLNDQMRQMRYTTDIATSNQLMSTLDNKVQMESIDQIRSQIQPSQQENLERDIIRAAEARFNLDTGTIGIPYSSLKTMYSLSDSTFDRMGYSAQILSPPAIDAGKYQTTQFGPYGIYGGETRATDLIETDHFSKLTTDEFYTTRINSLERPNSLGDITKMNSIDHFYTQKVTYNDFAMPYTPGVTVSGSRLERSAFYTPLQPGITSWTGTRSLLYPTTGYDPTDFGTRNIQQSLTYNVQINPGISNINRINSIPQVPSYTRIQKF